MASRFLMQKLSSQIARSRSIFATHASATASATEGGIRTLSNIFRVTAMKLPSNRGIHGYAGRHLNTSGPTSVCSQVKRAFSSNAAWQQDSDKYFMRHMLLCGFTGASVVIGIVAEECTSTSDGESASRPLGRVHSCACSC